MDLRQRASENGSVLLLTPRNVVRWDLVEHAKVALVGQLGNDFNSKDKGGNPKSIRFSNGHRSPGKHNKTKNEARVKVRSRTRLYTFASTARGRNGTVLPAAGILGSRSVQFVA